MEGRDMEGVKMHGKDRKRKRKGRIDKEKTGYKESEERRD